MTYDIPAELDRWRTTARTAANAYEFVPLNELLQRARDEIVALRSHVLREAEVIRNEALEEAALIAQNECVVPPDAEEEQEMCYHIAAAIRKLKGKRDG